MTPEPPFGRAKTRLAESVVRNSGLMRYDIAFLHTSPLHVKTFDTLIREFAPSLRVHHTVAEDLLAEARAIGANAPAVVERVQRAMKDAGSSGASVVVCTCSTIGQAAERTETNGAFVAMRIDRPMADRAVTLGPRVLLVAALESTVQPTTTLLEESAKRLSREIEVQQLLVRGAWEAFLRGDMDGYIRAIVEGIFQEVGTRGTGVNAVVLAQASMATAVEALSQLSCEVLASPRLGVQSAIAIVTRAESNLK